MPLIKTCSIDALEKNIEAEIRAGKPREQAVAIAHDTLRRACRNEGKPVPVRKAMDVVRKQSTTVLQTLILPKKNFPSREKVEAWLTDHEFDASRIRETGDSFRAQQRPAREFGAGTFRTIEIDEDRGVKGVIGRPKQQVTKRARSKEFLESAFERARAALNPRDFAVIFQAARASAGGQVSAKRRRERAYITAGEKQLVDKTPLREMSKAELLELAATVDKAYGASKKRGVSAAGAIDKARGIAAECRRRGLTEPSGRVYVELAGQTCAKPVAKGFLNCFPEGGMHAHGLDRKRSKTEFDGAHLHVWRLPATADFVKSMEDGSHQHAIADTGASTDLDGAHSHIVLLPNGQMAETRLGGAHRHELMIETSGFGGQHSHILVMPDGSELESLSIPQAVEQLQDLPAGSPLPPASEITSALLRLRDAQRKDVAGGPLPTAELSLNEAIEMTAKGETMPLPIFAVAVEDPEDFPGADVDHGDIVDVRYDGEIVGVSKHVTPDSEDDIARICTDWAVVEKHTTPVPFTGPPTAPLMFISGAPNELELARGEPVVGDDALTFQRLYLDPIGMQKRDVALGFAMPLLPHASLPKDSFDRWGNHLVSAMKSFPSARIVALGRQAREVLKSAGIEYVSLPHPSVVRKRGDRGEVGRKIRALGKSLDVPVQPVRKRNQQGSEPRHGGAPGNLTDAISEKRKTGQIVCKVSKSAEDKQIVYGVVLDPYEVDLQTEWVPPAEIESTAHGFLKKSRVIGLEHMERADAQIVESWVEPYPSKEDYLAALENRPHRAFKRQFGNDVIRSGAWVAGVQLGDREWQLHKKGELNAFSVGGFSFKTKITTAAMPEVEFVELQGL